MKRIDFGPKPLSLPQPVWIIATYDEFGIPNAMNAAWGGISEENEISVCLSPGHKTCKNFKITNAFSISMADRKHITACDYFGISSGNSIENKITKAGLTISKSNFVNAPIINELPVSIECKVKEYDETTCILKGEIINVSLREDCMSDGKADLSKIEPVCFDPFNNAYHVVGEKIADAFKEGKKLL